MDDTRLAYRVRTADTGDDAALRASIGATLAHPDKGSRRESYRGAAGKGDLLILERYDRQAREWHIAGFLEHHMRVDDTLTIRDIGTSGDAPTAGVVRYLLDQVFDSYRPTSAQVKVRRDAREWLEILTAIPGFVLEGEEYRRPHYWAIWRWDPQRAREATRAATRAPQRDPRLRSPGLPANRPTESRYGDRRDSRPERPPGPSGRGGAPSPGRSLPGGASPRPPGGPQGPRRSGAPGPGRPGGPRRPR